MKELHFAHAFMGTALCLTIASFAQAASVAESVSAARNVELPDIDGIVKNPGNVLEGIGGGSAEGLDDVKSHWADGMGALTGPAQGTVINCRDKTDTTCRAIQILDKGFPERPVIGDDILAGRDQIVDNPTTKPDNGTTGCKDVLIETAPVESTKTCRVGGWWDEKTCRIGPVEVGKVNAKHFACATGKGLREEKTCSTLLSGKPATSEWTQRCFFGKEAGKENGKVTEETSAVATAVFSGTCTSTQASVETVKCSETLEKNPEQACWAGRKFKASTYGDDLLQRDGCPDGDKLIAMYFCDYPNNLAVQITGFQSSFLSKGFTLTNVAHRVKPQCTADYRWESSECSGKICTAKIWGKVFYNHYMTGRMTVYINYPNKAYYNKKVWVDHCEGIRDKVK